MPLCWRGGVAIRRMDLCHEACRESIVGRRNWHAGGESASDDLGEAATVGFVRHDRQKRRGIDNHFGNPSSSYSQLVSELTGSRIWARNSLAISMT